MSATIDTATVGKSILAATPLKRFGLPVEIASAAEFIASNDYVTGSVVRVDGGCRLPFF